MTRQHQAGTVTKPGPHEIAAWVLMGLGLLLVLRLHLLPALIAGFVSYELIHTLARRLPIGRLSTQRAKIVAVALLAGITVTALALFVWGSIVFARSESGNLPALLSKMAEIIENSRRTLPDWLVQTLPHDAEGWKQSIAQWLRTHANELQVVGKEAGLAAAHVLIGLVIGALTAFHEVQPDHKHRPFAVALLGRIVRFGDAFRNVVFAQVRISLINTVFTALYLALVLPLFGINLPLTKTLIAVTFVAGLLPIVGNLVSNTIIVVVSLNHSLPVAIGSLAFLIVIHKLEYFLNARIVGAHISARSWELLIAMLALEAAFGVPGLVAAPIYYAYIKAELAERGLV